VHRDVAIGRLPGRLVRDDAGFPLRDTRVDGADLAILWSSPPTPAECRRRSLGVFHLPPPRHSVEVMGEYEHVLVKREKGTVTITMNRASRRNSLSADHLADLLAAFRQTGETDASGIVLAGAGPVFSAGHDFGDVAARDLAGTRELLRLCTDLMGTIQSVPQVVIARVHGLATAAGCQLVASCDLAVAARSAGFALPGGKGGWFCHTPAVPVARTVGRKRLMELALTGDVIDAATALDWGLVNRVVPDDAFAGEVVALRNRLAAGPTRSYAGAKRQLNHWLYARMDEQLELEADIQQEMAGSPDFAEGVAAFIQKRPPVFEGR
jgi:enoyl-CoA hydratase/carnithine racemase